MSLSIHMGCLRLHILDDEYKNYTLQVYTDKKVLTPNKTNIKPHTKQDYGFNGQEKDNEIYGAGNSYTAEYWNYDPRLGRRWNVDPMTAAYAHQSPYACFNDNPIYFADPLGLEGEDPEARESRSAKNQAGDHMKIVYLPTYYNQGHYSEQEKAKRGTLKEVRLSDSQYYPLYWYYNNLDKFAPYLDFKFHGSPFSFADIYPIGKEGTNGLWVLLQKTVLSNFDRNIDPNLCYNLNGERMGARATEEAANNGLITVGMLALDGMGALASATVKGGSVIDDVAKGGGPIVGGGAKLEYLGNNVERIQSIATKYNLEITVVGSRAKGTANSLSDWDYIIIGGTSKARSSALYQLPRNMNAVKDGMARPGSEILKGVSVDPTLPHIIFKPTY